MCRTKLIRNGYGLRDSKLHCSTIVQALGLYNTTLSGSANVAAVHPTFYSATHCIQMSRYLIPNKTIVGKGQLISKGVLFFSILSKN